MNDDKTKEISFADLFAGVANMWRTFTIELHEVVEGGKQDLTELVEYCQLYGRIEMLIKIMDSDYHGKKDEVRFALIPEEITLHSLMQYLVRYPEDIESISKEVDKIEKRIRDRIIFED